MPDWSDVEEYVRENYTITEEEDDWFSITFEFDDGRSQLVRCRHFTAYDDDWIEFSSVICSADEMAPKAALKKNFKLPIGAIALDEDDDYVLIHNAPLSTIDLEEFERPLHAVAQVADMLEEEHTGSDEW